MAVCQSKKYTGKIVGLEFHIGCGDVLPLESEWKKLGAMRNKEWSLEWESIDATADDSIGALRENIASFQNLTISGDGTLVNSGAAAANLKAITKHVAVPVETGGQPVVWFRMTFPDLTFIAYMLLTTMSRTAAYDDVATYSVEASSTASDFGLLVLDTPNPDDPALTALAIAGGDEVVVNSSLALTATPTPVGAVPSLIWSSSDPEIATVDQQGVVSGVAVGDATITVGALKSSITATQVVAVVLTPTVP